MYKVLFVGTKGTSKEREFASFEELTTSIGITQDENWETMELQDIKRIGIIARDQDLKGLEKNRLGIKGDFIICGMERIKGDDKEGTVTTFFRSLDDEELSQMRISLTMQTYKDLSNL